jgi:hypothetical protein
MSVKPTIVVVALAVIGVAAVVLLRRGEQQAPAAAGQVLLAPGDFPVDAVTRITLKRADAPAMVFARGPAGWWQTEPFEHPMDSFSIRQLAALAGQVEAIKRIDDGGLDLVDLGLEPPRAVAAFDWPQGSLTLQLGRRAVAGRSYLRILGDPSVFVVKGELYERAVEMDPKEWRDRTIFPGVSIDADRLVIDDRTTRTVLERIRRQWTMVEPVRTRLDGIARDELFSALGRAESGGFILDEPEDLSTFGLDDPAGQIAVASTRTVERDGEPVREPREQRLLIGARMGVGSEDRFGIVAGRPVVLRVPEAVLRAFFRPAVGLVDPTGSGVSAPNVKALLVRGPEGQCRLERDLERWLAPEHGVEVPAEAVEGLLDQVTARRAPAVEIRPYPREAEVATITMYGFDARPLDTVRVARDPQTGLWVLENGDNVLRVFPAETRMPLTLAEFTN